ncbi:MAG: CGNR zinc finger domain-containing protein [Segniliparus sp.]|uniref:CGNR zinc finger domain-containing protein n=1 Tax=Segniliparus sp. TaxID=2804064 RepID=UPI003F3ADD21
MNDEAAAVFRLDNASLAFRFTATLTDRPGRAFERLGTPGLLGLWLRANGLGFVAEPLAEGDLVAAVRLREHVYAAGAAVAAGRRPAPEDSGAINEWSRKGRPWLRLDDGVAQWTGSSMDDALSVLAADAAQTLGGPDRARVKACSDEHCRGLYLDTSRGGNRRWCSMNFCGNRAKKAAMAARG